MRDLIERIRARSAPIGVIGLGYVGLPVASTLAASGFAVTGVDLDADRVASINRGQCPIGGEEPGLAELVGGVASSGALRATTEYAALAEAQVVLICVDTPVDPETHKPSYRALRAALASLGSVLARGSLVIVESTIAPGTMDGVVRPELERASGLAAGRDFFLGHCPERVTPGLLLHNLTSMSRAVGGETPEVAEAMAALYGHYVQGDLDRTDPLTAEIVKTAENAYRDVEIAFANELALICEQLGADVYAVRELVNKSPGRAVLMPGAGVGGHCIPKDPWLLIANLEDAALARIVPTARAVNDGMPVHLAELLQEALAEHGVGLAGARIAILGYAFREDTDDDRDSPSERLVRELERRGSVAVVHDPYVPGYGGSIEDVARGAHALALMVAHRAYRDIDLSSLPSLMACPVLVDGRHAVDAAEAGRHGFTYRSIGVSPGSSGAGAALGKTEPGGRRTQALRRGDC